MGIVDLWPKIRADVKALNRRIEALLQQVDPAAVAGNQVVLVSPYEFHRNRVNTDEVRQVVEQVIGRLVSTSVTVTCVSREEAQQIASTAPVTTEPAPGRVIAEPAPEMTSAAAEPPAEDAGSALTDVVDAEGPTEQARKDDEARIVAARNIFDAEEITD